MSETSSSIGDLGGQFYFTPETVGRGKAAGIDGFRLYIIGRGGMMGNVSAAVAQSSFGYFNPGMLAHLWNSGIETMPATDIAELYWECAADHGRLKLSETEDLEGFCSAAEAVIAAADRDGLPLFAGAATMPLADDLPARAYQLAVVLRELRGSAHLAAIRSTGLAAREAHALKRPEMVKTFGWEDIEISDDAEAKLVVAEERTNDVLASTYAVLDADAAAAFVTGVAAMASSCGI